MSGSAVEESPRRFVAKVASKLSSASEPHGRPRTAVNIFGLTAQVRADIAGSHGIIPGRRYTATDGPGLPPEQKAACPGTTHCRGHTAGAQVSAQVSFKPLVKLSERHHPAQPQLPGGAGRGPVGCGTRPAKGPGGQVPSLTHCTITNVPCFMARQYEPSG